MTQIAFIGGGNMATSIIGGLIREGSVRADLIHVSAMLLHMTII